MFTQIRKLMAEDVNPLSGQVEVDETYIGGKRQGKRGRGASGKAVVMGLVERNGKAIAKVIPDVKAKTLLPMIELKLPKRIRPSFLPMNSLATIRSKNLVMLMRLSSTPLNNMSLALPTSTRLNPFGVQSSVVLMALITRVSPLYLQSYLDSYVFRYNHRKDDASMFHLLLGRLPVVCQKQA